MRSRRRQDITGRQARSDDDGERIERCRERAAQKGGLRSACECQHGNRDVEEMADAEAGHFEQHEDREDERIGDDRNREQQPSMQSRRRHFLDDGRAR